MTLEVIYDFNNIFYKIIGSEELHHKLQSDPDFGSKYIHDNLDTCEMIGEDELKPENSQSPEENMETVEVELDGLEQEQNLTWSKSATALLLSCVQKRKHMLRDPKFKKKLIWKEMKREFDQNGYSNIDEQQIERKFRNMKQTYKNIKENLAKGRTEHRLITWEYFHEMVDIFEGNITVDLDEAIASIVGEPNATQGHDYSIFMGRDHSWGKSVWNRRNTSLLLNCVQARKDMLKNPVVKRAIWKEIKKEFDTNGFDHIDEYAIERKFRNMKHTYITIKDKKRSRCGRVSWAYFDIMNDIFDDEDEDFAWNRKATNIFLNCLRKRKHIVRGPNFRRKQLWKAVRLELEDHGFKVEEYQIERKFRNMKQTYKSIKLSVANKKLDRDDVQWEHYDAFAAIIEDDDTNDLGGGITTANIRAISNELVSSLSQKLMDSTPKAEPAPASAEQPPKRSRLLIRLRKQQVELDKERLQELRELRITIERNNQLQFERNLLLREMIDNKMKVIVS